MKSQRGSHFSFFAGHALQWDDIIIEGDPQKYKFVAYYVKNNKVLAVCSMNADPAVSMAAELMYQQKMPSGEEVKWVTSLFGT